MRAFGWFLVRYVAYAIVLGIVARIAASLWVSYGLDGSIDLQPLHDDGVLALSIAPLVLALLGFGVLRVPAIFAGAFLAGAALTAPFACAHFTGL